MHDTSITSNDMTGTPDLQKLKQTLWLNLPSSHNPVLHIEAERGRRSFGTWRVALCPITGSGAQLSGYTNAWANDEHEFVG
jgi:hypothetical protein